MQTQEYISKKVAQTAVINVNVNIKNAFPLFGAFEERKWAEGWNPTLIYPSTEIIEEGTTFKTEGRDEEPEYLWRVSKYYPQENLIQYMVSTENRHWTITVKCIAISENKTSAEITYTFIGLNETGNRINEQSLARMYKK
ncbi:MAG: hypothetical protein IPH97_04495 [Ignavibacteriales bacterium]|nr:hypothetical protein [Ignavibacteriales bacterium]